MTEVKRAGTMDCGRVWVGTVALLTSTSLDEVEAPTTADDR